MFSPRSVISLSGDECLLYGNVQNETEVLAAVVISEKTLDRLVNSCGTHNMVKIRIRTQTFLNKTSSLDVRENKGLVIIYGVEPENVEVIEHASC